MFKSRSILVLFCFISSLHLSLAAYDPAAALEYAYACGLTHCSQESIQAWNCGNVCQKLAGYQPFYTEKHVVGYGQTFSVSMIVNPSTKKFVTAYRGTEGNIQLLLEILQGGSVKYKLTDIPGADVDNYFYNSYVKHLRTKITAKLKEAYSKYPTFKFVFTGHSLGGALTTLTAFDAVSSGVIPRSQAIMYNYGSPRVGNYILTQAIEAAIPEIYRITHYKDIVPHVPPCLRGLNGECGKGKALGGAAPPATWPAYHLKNEIFYNEDNSSYVICNGGEDRKCAGQYNIFQTSMDYHSNYLGIHINCSGKSAYQTFNIRGSQKTVKH